MQKNKSNEVKQIETLISFSNGIETFAIIIGCLGFIGGIYFFKDTGLAAALSYSLVSVLIIIGGIYTHKIVLVFCGIAKSLLQIRHNTVHR